MIFPTLETPRLLIKALSPEDVKFIFENHPKAEIKKILGLRSEEDYLKEEHKHKNGYACYNRTFKRFLLIDKTSGTIIGKCGFHNWNTDHNRAEVGYAMEDENYRRKGLMSEALNAVIAHGFAELKLHRIEALVGINNTASLRLMEKFGFVKEGSLREHYLINNKFEDSVVFSKLRSEYLNGEK